MSYRDMLTGFALSDSTLKRVDNCYKKQHTVDMFPYLFEKTVPGTYYVSEHGGLPDESCTYWITVIRLEDKMFIFHSDCVATVYVMDDATVIEINTNPTEANWRTLFEAIGYKNFQLNQYQYMEFVIEDFWKSVFNKTLQATWNDGIVTAHGDKFYGYKTDWEEHGIPFNRGCLICLLTYTTERGDYPKHKSREWVIENYQKYLPAIIEAEKNAGIGE